jgi:hypothetical protein
MFNPRITATLFSLLIFVTEITLNCTWVEAGREQTDLAGGSGAEHYQFSSTLQFAEHPSPFRVFPSSQGALYLIPSPHIS